MNSAESTDERETRPTRHGRGSVILRNLDGKIDQTLRTQLDPLVSRLRIAFRQPTRMRFRRGFATGSRREMPAAMRFAADRRNHDRLWMRLRPVAEVSKAAVFLLVDLSGSMAGAEIEAAILGTTLLARTFERLGPRLKFVVEGFSRSADWVQDFFPPGDNRAERQLQGDGAGGRRYTTA